MFLARFQRPAENLKEMLAAIDGHSATRESDFVSDTITLSLTG